MGLGRLTLVGGGELAEIALLAASEAGVDIIAVIDVQAKAHHCQGVPVVTDMKDVAGYDGVVITDAYQPQLTYERLREQLPATRILVPALLRITPDRADLLAAGRQMDQKI